MTRSLRLAALPLVVVLVVVLAVSAVALLLLLQDANRFKPQLQSLIEDQTGVPVQIAGDLSWRLWPPLSLSAEDVSANHEGQAWQVGRLSLKLDLFRLIAARDDWEVESITLSDVIMRQEGSVLHIARARIDDLAANRPAAIKADLSYTPDGQPPMPVNLDGRLQIDPQTLDLALMDTRIETDMAAGTCNATASPVSDPRPAQPPAAAAAAAAAAAGDEIIPVDVFRSYNWSGACLLDWLQVDDRRFEQVIARFDNQAGNSAFELAAPRFFGGQALAEIGIDARRTPLRWAVTPTLTDVDSVELMTWLDQRLQWAAPLAYGGTLTFEGNRTDELLASMSGETRFDGGQGRINIAKIKDQLVTLAAMFNEAERIQGWPEVWEYQRFLGSWRIDRQQHRLDFALDNLQVTGIGDYAPATDEMDMALELVFANDPAWPVFQIHPMLYDLPIPIRCRGALADPTCRLDSAAAQRVVARVLAGGEDNELRARVEEKIDTQVPAQYRDAARGLLDLLGRQAKPEAERKPRGN
ncbi:MAG: AsmA family protein [Pseudomonadales bacterium]